MFRSASVVLALCATLTGPPMPAAAGAAIDPLCVSGGTPAPLAWIEKLPDGGEIHHYKVDGDTMVPEVPSEFNPLSATAEQLDTYGFPPRPTSSSALAQWEDDMANWQHTPDRGLCITNSHFSTDTPWSGHVVPRSVDTYIAVQGNFKQPYYGSSNCTDPEEGSWTGIGGYETGSLLQTGTAMRSTGKYAWYEYIDPAHPNPAIEMPSVSVHAGNRIHTYVLYQRSTGRTTFYVANNSNGTQQSVIRVLSSSYWDGMSAEAIDEAPVGADLADFDTVSWGNLQAEDLAGDWHSFGSQGKTRV